MDSNFGVYYIIRPHFFDTILGYLKSEKSLAADLFRLFLVYSEVKLDSNYEYGLGAYTNINFQHTRHYFVGSIKESN